MSAIDLAFTLDDVYSREEGQLYMSGIQALVRLPLMQRRMDRAAGLNTAGLVSGYRGSPLGAYDQQLWRAAKHLAADDVIFQPGLNEDLAATALWGAQMHRAYGPTKVDGVFGIWYGKGPGVDRSGDVLRNANILGTSALGGVIALAGDDHAAQSSMFPHQTDGIFQSVMMPILQPSSVREILTLGMAGFALSRFSGLWIAMKTIAEVVESSGSFPAPDARPNFLMPQDFIIPPHGLNWDPQVAWPGQRNELERRLVEERLPAALAWVRANGVEGIVQDAPRKRIVIVTVGKAHQDLMEAMAGLGITPARAAALGVCIYKVAMSWPLETERLKVLAAEAETLFVVEEKRPFVEDQLKAALYNIPADRRAKVVGKRDEAGALLLPEILEFDPLMVARAVVRTLSGLGGSVDGDISARLDAWIGRAAPADRTGLIVRPPFFCAGCPHNTSTKTPDGSISGGGIGCHIMALTVPALNTTTFSQMGGEGVQWVGAAPFVETPHTFQNLGDGTYQHSGILAVRAAVAAKTNVTFKILYNDAVAMTGGQPAEGDLDPLQITRQLAAEGVGRVTLVSDDPAKWEKAEGLAAGTKVLHRDEMDALQRDLRETPGVTAIVYEQTCASEKRRRRKRGAFPDPDRRLFINPRVCEGCGDCQVQSSCIAVEPVVTGYGTKRQINQSSCNKDFSCVKGFCPSFVEIEGVALRKPDAKRLDGDFDALMAALPQPTLAPLGGVFNIFVAGVGGTGVLTLGALLGAAAHVEGLAASTLDFTGLAQKNGGVTSQVRFAVSPDDLHAVRIGAGDADLLLAADVVVGASAEALARLSAERSRVALNQDAPPTAEAVLNRDATLPSARLDRAIDKRALSVERLHATHLAEALFGEATTANTLLLGFAWQKGWLPLTEQAILRAIEINGVAVKANLLAFRWGRLTAHDLPAVERIAGLRIDDTPESPEALRARLSRDLAAYQDARYAARFDALVDQVAAAEAGVGGDGALTQTVARQAYRLMAYKDEYEVARLYSEQAFEARLSETFGKREKLSLWLAPPILSRTDPATGRPKKRKFGPWIFPVLKLMARGKGLRGTALDIFGYTEERRMERGLITRYEADVARICGELTPARYAAAVALANWPSEARGFGPVKAAGLAVAEANRVKFLAAFETPEAALAA